MKYYTIPSSYIKVPIEHEHYAFAQLLAHPDFGISIAEDVINQFITTLKVKASYCSDEYIELIYTDYYKMHKKLFIHKEYIDKYESFCSDLMATHVIPVKYHNKDAYFITHYDKELIDKSHNTPLYEVYIKTVTSPTTTVLTNGYSDIELDISKNGVSHNDLAYYVFKPDSSSFFSCNPEVRVSEDLKTWKTVGSPIKSLSRDYLKEQIRSRYGFFERPRNGLANVIVDSFFPRLMYANNMNTEQARENANLPKTAVAISEFIANSLGIKQMSTEQMCRTLGYTPKDIKNLLTVVKKKDLTMIFAGVGGTGVNTAYFLDKMCQMTHTINLFKKVLLFERDNIEFSNIFRFPVDIREITPTLPTSPTNKMQIVAPIARRLSRTKIETYSKFVTQEYSIPHQYRQYAEGSYHKLNPDVFIYGAPGIEHRENISKNIGNFICATHASTTCSIWLNPHQDLDLQVESYGMIQLGGFFMNQLRMAIGLLELLASDQDLSEQDKHILDFEFDGTIQGTTDRTYNWQIDRNLLMMTEEQANNL